MPALCIQCSPTATARSYSAYVYVKLIRVVCRIVGIINGWSRSTRGRLTIPKELRMRLAIIIPAGSFFIITPSRVPDEEAMDWLVG